MPVLLGALILAPHAAAEVVVDPDTQPPATLAPYALKSTNLEAGATRAYRPWFENGTWMGDLVEYTISQQGERTTDVPVGAYPPEQGEENWSARAGFPEHERDLDGDGEALEEPDDVFWKERNLFTVKECSANPCNTVPFWWDRLSDHQKSSLDPVAFADEDAQDGPEAKASELLNFVRGDRSHERDQEGGRLRLRFSVLGDIINSRPVYLPAGSHGLALVGSNGGMLHGFNAETGKEVFGYVPSMLLGKLDRLARVPYRHTYFVDGELRGRSFDDRHVVAGGLGAGARGLFALDVSDPTDPDVLFELSGSDNEDIGHIHGRPGIARLPDDKWYVIFGNGYLSDSDRAKLILMPVSGGSPITITTNYAGNNGLSAPALVDLDGNGRVDYAYAGDLRGNVWRFDLDAQTRTRLFTDSRGNPITVEPDVARHPTGSGVMVYVGTGSLLSAADLDVTSEQSVYGLWDRLDDSSPIDSARLIQQELVEVTRDWDGNERTVRVIGTTDDDGELVDIEPNWHGEGHDLGWMVPLPSEGERLLGHPQIRGGRLQFTSLNPSQRDADDVRYNESWIIQLGLASGGSPQRALFDLNRDERLDEEDGLAMAPPGGEAQHKYPVALRLGRGNIAQPAFARVVQYIDAVFINGLLLPESIDDTGESLVFGGDIDVTTDSPHGPLVNPHEQDPDYPDDGRKTDTDPDARGPMNKHLAADGLGNRLDGHHRAYDKVHNVRYIDYFDLEPRRGLRSLLPTGEPYDVLPELNRVTEVNGLTDDQKFIVVLTNADLSKGTELQIGCRAWPSYEYQEMITPQLLRDETSLAELKDQNGESLIFTLEDITNDKGGVCDSEEREPTLRITVTDRVGKDGVLQGTLPGCVNDSHSLEGDENLDEVNHITPNNEGRGYRWRNGALTMQLLAVNNSSADYTLQTDELPTARGGGDTGNGGIFAKGFQRDGSAIKIEPKGEHNGLLYESSIFWNWGDMQIFQQAGQGIKCYGGQAYNALLTQEAGGLNPGQYDGLVSELRNNEELQNQYAGLLSDLADAAAAGNEDGVQRALKGLAELFAENPKVGSWGVHGDLSLQDYHRLRSYSQTEQFNPDLLDIDQGLFDGSQDVDLDGTPADVTDVELDLLPAAGPNYQLGRRSWIDIVPE